MIETRLLPLLIAASGALLASCAQSSAIHDGGGGDLGEGGGDPSGPSVAQDVGAGGSSTGADNPSTGSGAVCGDNTCAATETCTDCPDDCGECGATCGDGVCDVPIESAIDCPSDCTSTSVCGDAVCSPDETCQSCYQDCGVCACVADGFEPNQQSPSATPVTSGTDYCNLSICSGDVDWLAFTVAHGFTAKISFIDAIGDIDLEIYSAQTIDYVTGSYGSGDDETVTLSGLSSGTYWARIYGPSAAENPSYCFRVDTN